jgi:hypothetical protein
MRVETRAVLADAYTGKNRSLKGTLLRHAVEVDDSGAAVRVLGGRCVQLDSLADGGDLDEDERAAKATCPRCASKDPRPEPHQIIDGRADRPGSGLYGRLTGEELQAALLASRPGPEGHR